MACIQYTGLVAEIQGKLNGSVLSRGRSSAVIYSKPKPRKEPTKAQLSIRAGFSNAAAAWRTLSDSERDDWETVSDANPLPNRFGDLVAVSGYAYFKRMMALAFPTSGGSPLVANLTMNPAYQFTPDGMAAEMELLNEGYRVNFASLDAIITGDSPSTNQWNVYVSLPVPQANFPYFKTWYFVASSFFGDNEGIGNPLNFAMGNKILPKGFRTFDGALHLWKAVCFVPGHGSVSVEQIWSNVAAWVPPLVPPVLTLTALNAQTIYTSANTGAPGFTFQFEPTPNEDIRILYRVEFQWAPAVPAQTPPGSTDWGDIVNNGIVYTGLDWNFVPDGQVSAVAWYNAYNAEFPASANPLNGWWIPLRLRLVEISGPAVGAWSLQFVPVQALF